jgi:hypothetical protein
MPTTDPQSTFGSKTVTLAQASATAGEHLVVPLWLPFLTSGPTDVQQAVSGEGAIVTITRYQDPNSEQWAMIHQFHIAQHNQTGPTVLRQVTVDSVPVTLFELSVSAAGSTSKILGAFWTHRLTAKSVELQTHGVSEADLLRVAASIE